MLKNINVTRPIIIVTVTILGFLNAIVRPSLQLIDQQGFASSAIQGFGISMIVWMAVMLVIRKMLESSNDSVSTFDIILVLVVLVLFQIPSSTISWLTLAGFATALIFNSHNDRSIRVGGQVLLALALREPVSNNLLHIFAPYLLFFDALMVQSVFSLAHIKVLISGNLISGINDYNLVILTGCSSFINLSYALLCWYSISKTMLPKLSPKVIFVGIIVIFFVPLLNHIRLALMVYAEGFYVFLHGPLGNDLYDLLVMSLVLLVTFWGVGFEKIKA